MDLTSIEKVSLASENTSWQYNNESLPIIVAEGASCVIYNGIIYVIGGFNISSVTMINTMTGKVSLSPDPLNYDVSNFAAIVVGHTIYIFGGYSEALGPDIDEWSKYELETINPTQVPT